MDNKQVKIHPVEVMGCSDMKRLADMVGNLRYDQLEDFLSALTDKLRCDAEADLKRGRGKLSMCLKNSAVGIEQSKRHIHSAWGICEPHMKGV